jgi:uncharacterized protein
MTEGSNKGGRCSICGAPVDPQLRPFCSKRCADIDLSRWLTGSYAVPGGEADADEDGDDSDVLERERTSRNTPPDRMH